MDLARSARAALAVALCAAAALAASRMPIPEERPYDLPVVPTAGTARWLFPSHPTLAGNLYWLRAVQYIGEPRGNERGWDRLLPVAELVTDLDPRHGYAYQVAGTILSAVERVAESNRILEKGVRNVPDRYILPYHRAFNAFYYDHDFAAAGRWAEVASRAKGAPEHLRQSVLAYYVKGNRADLAIRYLEDALAAAQDDDSRRAIRGQLEQARVERAAAIVDDALERYRAARGFPALTPEALVAEGFLPRLPPDPAGGEWILDEDGRARSTAHDRRLAPAPAPHELGAAPGIGSAQRRGGKDQW
jgi:tetratricopeptide (TPR) repeat protein